MIVRELGLIDYATVWEAMKNHTQHRIVDQTLADELWLVEHPPVFTQGQAGKPEHILNPQQIPVIQTDRGGQVTYHGPGQAVVYVLLNLKTHHLGIRGLVTLLEQTVIDLLKSYAISASTRCKAPGVYVDDAKICSIGLRVKKGHTYHGIALNIDMDLSPFSRINPCGFEKLAMTQMSELISSVNAQEIQTKLIQRLAENLGHERFVVKTQLPEAFAENE